MKDKLFKVKSSAFILPASDFILGFQLRLRGGLAYNLSLEHLVRTKPQRCALVAGGNGRSHRVYM